MDAHFPEYLAAIAGMRECYGERCDEREAALPEAVVPAIEPAACAAVESVA